MKTKSILTLILLFLIIFNLNAGWKVIKSTYDSDQGVESAFIEAIFIQENKMKIIQDEITTIFDLNEKKITLINPGKELYWKGDIAKYKQEMKLAMEAAMNEQLENAPGEQMEMIKKMYQGMMESIDNPSKFAGEEPEEYDLIIKNTNEKDKIAGNTAVKYQVTVNGILKEEAWLSESNKVHKEFDITKFKEFFADFINQLETGTGYKRDVKYIEFEKKGFPLKSVSYYGGYETISEVTSIHKQNIESSEFNPPKGYKQVNLMEMGLNEPDL